VRLCGVRGAAAGAADASSQQVQIVKKKQAVADSSLRGRFRTQSAEPLKLCDRERKKKLVS